MSIKRKSAGKKAEKLVLHIINKYKNEKLSMRQIADNEHISPYRVQSILKKHNISIRNPSESATVLYQTRDGYRAANVKKCLSEKERLLKIAGLMLYFGEGTKNGGVVALSNSNPKMIKLFMRFLTIICNIQVERMHITLHHYQDQKPSDLISFWSKCTDIPHKQFYKSYLHTRTRGTYRQLSKYGTVSLQYGDAALLRQILKEIETFVKQNS